MNLKRIRKSIDRTDTRILKLINKRLKSAQKTSPHKQNIFDAEREKRVREHVKKQAKKFPSVREEFALDLFDLIISESRRTQKQKNRRRTS
ncbi:MAG: chorismate mutase [Candidatus Aminicenantaceae bacterium]